MPDVGAAHPGGEFSDVAKRKKKSHRYGMF
jgi:hypothetical protein